jgi:hypothetical protein
VYKGPTLILSVYTGPNLVLSVTFDDTFKQPPECIGVCRCMCCSCKVTCMDEKGVMVRFSLVITFWLRMVSLQGGENNAW